MSALKKRTHTQRNNWRKHENDLHTKQQKTQKKLHFHMYPTSSNHYWTSLRNNTKRYGNRTAAFSKGLYYPPHARFGHPHNNQSYSKNNLWHPPSHKREQIAEIQQGIPSDELPYLVKKHPENDPQLFAEWKGRYIRNNVNKLGGYRKTRKHRSRK